MTDNLTIHKSYTADEVMHWLDECNSVGIEPDMARQLLVTMRQLETMRDAVIERYDALHEIIEIYAGMDGFKPKTAPEAYQQRIIEQMHEVANNCLNEEASEY